MDSTTIEKIEDLALSAAKANRVNGKPGDGGIPAVIVNGEVMSLERFQAGRSRFRGQFETNTLSEFAGYVKAHGGAHGFIDADRFCATVFHNLGVVDNPGHGDWTSVLTLKPTAAYAAMLAVEGKALGQKQLVEWIEDWSPNLQAKMGVESPVFGITQALAAIRKLTISAKSDVTHTDKDFGASRSALEEIEAKADGGIPSHLVFTCTPYLGFASRTFALRLSVITGDKPALTLRIVSKEAEQEDMAREFKSLLIESIGDAAEMTIGTFEP